MSEDDHAGPPRPGRQREAFFGRVKGKRLRPRQSALMEGRLDALSLDLAKPAPADPAALFAAAVREVRLEIGFGAGENLLATADHQPDVGFLGAEAFVNSLAKVVAALDAEPRGNLLLYPDDATRLLDWLPPASLAGVDLFYPDPWPKRRHWKRRFVSPGNLDRIARVLRPGGLFRFASDIDTYVDWTLLAVRDHGGLRWTATRAADWREPYEGWVGTRYEGKAHREGRKGTYLTFMREDR